jgi:thioesterase domain-containing protein/acyl carrier protein
LQDNASSERISPGDALLLRRADLGLSTPWIEPKSDAERKLAEIWRQVLGVDPVGATDNFFDLGGDSFMATTLAVEIEATFGVRFAPGDIIGLPTIAQQARCAARSRAEVPVLPPYIVASQAEGIKPPLFMVHGAGGFIFFKPEFLEIVGHDRPVYLFQAPGLDGRTAPLKSVEEIARAYITSMRTIQHTGPYYISAMCTGCFIALEMSNQLTDTGQTVARLILLDPESSPPALNRRSKHRRLDLFIKALFEGDLASLRRAILGSLLRSDPFVRRQKRRARWAQKLHAKIHRDVPVTTSEDPGYSAKVMLDASLQLYDALRAHVPRPYAGRALLLLGKRRAREISSGKASFWEEHVADISYEVIPDIRHTELFSSHIKETASFVRKALESPG